MIDSGNKQDWNEGFILEQKVLKILEQEDGLTDKEISERLKYNWVAKHTSYNICLQLAAKGFIKRTKVKGEPVINRINRVDQNEI